MESLHIQDIMIQHEEHFQRIKPFYKERQVQKLVVMGFLLIITAGAEFTAGIITNSLALIADAWHVLADEIAVVIGLTSLLLTRRRRTSNATYGWARASIVGALINGVFLFSLGIFIILS